MSKTEIFKRYLIFTAGLFVSSMGVAIVTKADLGTSPISAIPYVLSLYFPLTLGQFTIIFSLVLIAVQLIILRKDFKAEHILQIPVSFIFGYFIDFSMMIINNINPEVYAVKLIMLLLGCIVLGIGVYLEVLADAVMLPGESFVRAVVYILEKNFGTTKIAFDVSMTITAAALSLIFMSHLAGVREGTMISALLVGFIAGRIGRQLGFLPEKLFESAQKKQTGQNELIWQSLQPEYITPHVKRTSERKHKHD